MPTGIMWLAAWLEKHGYQVEILDGARLREAPEKLAERARQAQADLIGISGIITSYAYIISLSHALKKNMPETPIVLGAQVVINNLINCFKHMAIDYAISGYGEIPLLKLVRFLEGDGSLNEIPGLTYRDGRHIVSVPGREYVKDVNELPIPAYHHIDMEYYISVNGPTEVFDKYRRVTGKTAPEWRMAKIKGTLGCTDRCSFCVHEQEFVGLKRFSIDYLRKHIRHLRERYNINVLNIGEEMFITTLKNIKPFNELMVNEFPEIFWTGNTRANHVTKNIIQELEKGNCYQVAWGFESGSQRMLDLMQKRISREQNIDAFVNADRSSIGCSMTFMVGNVGETDSTMKETVAAIRESKMPKGGVFFAQPYPGGRTWDWAVEKGLIEDTHAYLLKAADKDASNFVINMTPYPKWVLSFWQRQLFAAFQRNALPLLRRNLSLCETPGERKALIKETIISTIRGWLPHKIPFFLHHLVTKIYCGVFDLRARFFPTDRDRQYAFEIDSKNAICPSQLLVSRPQRYLAPDQLREVLSSGVNRASLDSKENPFIDGVHARLVFGEEKVNQPSGE